MATVKGYAGSIGHVDLTSGKFEAQELSEELARDFVGGFGIQHKLALDLFQPGVDPLSPENVIIFGAGALAGTIAPSSSKVFATTKLPSPKGVGTVVAGSFGDALKYAGFDHIVIRGKCAKPSYLLLEDGRATVMDAAGVWGQDIYDATDALRRRHGDAANVITIGRAGENLVRFAFCLANKFGTLGRGGLGAVMGSKNLKAIVALGSRPIDVAHRRRFQSAANTILDTMRNLPFREEWLKVGSGIAGLRARRGESPDAPYSYARYLENYWQGPNACPSCPVSCKFAVRLKHGKYAGVLAPMSSPLSMQRFWGESFNNPDMERALETMLYCDREGLDAKTASSMVNLAINLYQDGVLTEETTHGMPLKRDIDTAATLLEQITHRQGFGDLLAEGHEAMIARYGKEVTDRVPMVKGMETTYEPRVLFNCMVFSQSTNPRGSYGVAGNNPTFLPNRTPEELRRYLSRLHIPEETIDRIAIGPTNFNLGLLTKYTEDWFGAQNCLGFCVRQAVNQCYNVEISAELYSAASGFETTPEQLLKLGEKAWNALKMLNAREGFTRKDDKFPDQFYEPLVIGGETRTLKNYHGYPITREEVEAWFDDYYTERGWDVETGLPTEETLASLGLK